MWMLLSPALVFVMGRSTLASRWRCWGCGGAQAGYVRRFYCVFPIITGAFGRLLLWLAEVVKAMRLSGFQRIAARAGASP